MAKEESSGNKWFDMNVNPDIAKILVRLNIKLPTRDEAFNRDFRPDIGIDYDDLETQLEEMPSIYAFWSNILSEQRAQVSMVERIIKSKKGKIFGDLITADGSIAKWKVDEHIESDDDICKMESKLVIEKRKESKLFGIVDAMRMKSEHLRSLAGFKRQELRDA